VGTNPSKGKAPFLLPLIGSLKFHTKYFTLPGNAAGIVTWSITAYSHKKKQLVSTDMAFNVVLKKEKGIYRIVSLEKLQ
jgi:hypothetical protein